MKFIVNRKYIDGPLDGNDIPLRDWPDHINHLVVTDAGKKHVYIRRSRCVTRANTITSQISGECSIRYGGKWEEYIERQHERVLPFNVGWRDLDDDEKFNELVELVTKYVTKHSAGIPVLIEIARDVPAYTCTQVAHSGLAEKEIREFLEFVRELRWDEKHDDVQRENATAFKR